ncbi:MAG: hypothetical protein HC906_18655 [Bacteroidales bacterium]|nr:hypothetical protein [Bacteroidales bacterium]
MPQPQNPYKKNGRDPGGNIGLDAKIGLTTNFTADVSVNPDFGQVESDPSVINLTAFETFYEERRPLFVEGGNIFSFELDDASMFYSRRIGQAPGYSPEISDDEYVKQPENTTILSAVKLSGKTSKGFSLGILQSVTANEYAEIKKEGEKREMITEPLTSYAIARLQQDFKEGNTVIGGIFTSTNRTIQHDHLNSRNKDAYTGGIDFLHHWNDKEFYIDAKLIGSHISGEYEAIRGLQESSARYFQRPGAKHLNYNTLLTQLSGFGGELKVGKGSKGLWRYSAGVNWKSPGLDLNDMGFMHSADEVEQSASLSYFVNQPVSVFRTYSVEIEQLNDWDFGMNYLPSGANLNVRFELLNKWSVRSRTNYTSEALDTRILRGGEAMFVPSEWQSYLGLHTDPSKKAMFSIGGNILASKNNQNFYSVEPGITVNPLNTLRISLSTEYSFNHNNLQYIDTKELNEDKGMFSVR